MSDADQKPINFYRVSDEYAVQELSAALAISIV